MIGMVILSSTLLKYLQLCITWKVHLLFCFGLCIVFWSPYGLYRIFSIQLFVAWGAKNIPSAQVFFSKVSYTSLFHPFEIIQFNFKPGLLQIYSSAVFLFPAYINFKRCYTIQGMQKPCYTTLYRQELGLKLLMCVLSYPVEIKLCKIFKTIDRYLRN